MILPCRTSLVASTLGLIFLATLCALTEALSPLSSSLPPSTSLVTPSSSSLSLHSERWSRRDFVRVAQSYGTAVGLVVVANVPQQAVAADLSALKEELNDSKRKLTPIPDLLQAQEWDKVRNILKTPPVNKLWNLGDSQNTVMQLAKEIGDPELFELKDELSYQLQICDQLTYDNVFVYFQPGSGKINMKGPTDAAKNAMKYLDQIIEASK